MPAPCRRHAGAERTVYRLLAAHDEIREWRDQRAERRSRNCAVHLLWKPLTPGNFARGVMRHTRQGPLLAHVRLHTVQERVTSAAPQYFLVIPFVLLRAATAPPPAMIRHLLSLAACMLLSSAVLRAQDTPAYTLSLAEQQADLPPEGQAVNGTMTRVKSTNNIVTREQFGEFELSLEWKQALGGNSGSFYRATAVASVYGSSPSSRGGVHADGGWNSTRVVAQGAHVKPWLNDVLIAQHELWSPEWLLMGRGDPNAATKTPFTFATFADFGVALKEFPVIRGDHNGDLCMCGIKIREIK
jgi:hypothetical protein